MLDAFSAARPELSLADISCTTGLRPALCTGCCANLWEKPDRETSAELARLFNWGTILTLTPATAVSYLVLFVGTALAAALLIDTSVLEQTLQRSVDFTDYLTLAWIISSLATVGGAIGSGLENEDTVRAAAFGYHPEPGGWRNEKDG